MSTRAPLRVVIADDEPPARRRVRAFLAGEPDLEVVGEAGDGAEALALIQATSPDVAFLDVQMPVATGLEVAAALGPGQAPAVVFVTAYDAYALRAFDVHALDYLVKPFDQERFARALARAREHVRRREGPPALEARLRAVLDALPPPEPRWLERLVLRVDGRIRFLPVDDIDWLAAEGNYVRVHAGGRSHLVRETLAGLEARLDPARFLRIHRSLVVAISRIVELEPLYQGEFVVRLRGGVQLTSGRTYRARIQEALGLGR